MASELSGIDQSISEALPIQTPADTMAISSTELAKRGRRCWPVRASQGLWRVGRSWLEITLTLIAAVLFLTLPFLIVYFLGVGLLTEVGCGSQG